MGRSPYTGFFGRLRSEDRLVVEDAIAAMGIEKLKGRMIQTLSDGERQEGDDCESTRSRNVSHLT